MVRLGLSCEGWCRCKGSSSFEWTNPESKRRVISKIAWPVRYSRSLELPSGLAKRSTESGWHFSLLINSNGTK